MKINLKACSGFFCMLVWAAVIVAAFYCCTPAPAADVKLAWNANPEPNIAGYRLLYGTQSGQLGTVVETGNVTTHTLSGLDEGRTYYFALRAVNTAGQQSDPCPEISYTIPVSPLPAPAPKLIDRTGWVVTVSAEQTTYPGFSGASAIDGDPATIWHNDWLTLPPGPHWIAVDTGARQWIGGFRYLPRQDNPSGGILAGYELAASDDGTEWTRVNAGILPTSDRLAKVVTFAKPVQARHVKLQLVSEIAGRNDYLSVAELDLLAVENPPEPEPPPTPPTGFMRIILQSSIDNRQWTDLATIWEGPHLDREFFRVKTETPTPTP